MGNEKQSKDHPGARPISLWDLYRFSYYLALRSLSWNHVKSERSCFWNPATTGEMWRFQLWSITSACGLEREFRMLAVPSSPHFFFGIVWVQKFTRLTCFHTSSTQSGIAAPKDEPCAVLPGS